MNELKIWLHNDPGAAGTYAEFEARHILPTTTLTNVQLFLELLDGLKKLSRTEVIAHIPKKRTRIPNVEPHLKIWRAGKELTSKGKPGKIWVGLECWDSELHKHRDGRVYFE